MSLPNNSRPVDRRFALLKTTKDADGLRRELVTDLGDAANFEARAPEVREAEVPLKISLRTIKLEKKLEKKFEQRVFVTLGEGDSAIDINVDDVASSQHEPESEVNVFLRAKAAGTALPPVAEDLLRGDTVIIQRSLLDLLVRGDHTRHLSAENGFKYLAKNGVTIVLERFPVNGNKHVLGIYCEFDWQPKRSDHIATALGLGTERLHTTGETIDPSERLHVVSRLSDSVRGMDDVFVIGEVDAFSGADGKVCLHEVKTRKMTATPFKANHLKKYFTVGVSKYVTYWHTGTSIVAEQVVDFDTTPLEDELTAKVEVTENTFVWPTATAPVQKYDTKPSKKCPECKNNEQCDTCTRKRSCDKFHFHFARTFIDTIKAGIGGRVQLAENKVQFASQNGTHLIDQMQAKLDPLQFVDCTHFPKCRNGDACRYYHNPAKNSAQSGSSFLCHGLLI
ncbi:MAG: hypothetical protein MHM6MM_007277 [Cercozoa sp. M6MM]